MIAVIGTGSIGMRHLDVLKKLSYPSVAIPTRPARLAELKDQGYLVAESLDQAVASGAKGVLIATNTDRHFGDIETALRFHLPTLAEKPLTLKAKEALQIAEMAQKHSCPLYVACCLRFDRGLLDFRRLLPNIGIPHRIHIEARSYFPDWRPNRNYKEVYSAQKGSGGVLYDLIHEVDYAAWLFGRPKSVSGFALNSGIIGIQDFDMASAQFVMRNQAIMQISLDYVTRNPVRFVQVSGSLGDLDYDFRSRKMSLQLAREPAQEFLIPGQIQDMYEAQMKEFVSIIENKETSGIAATAREGFLDLKICETWAESQAKNSQLLEIQDEN